MALRRSDRVLRLLAWSTLAGLALAAGAVAACSDGATGGASPSAEAGSETSASADGAFTDSGDGGGPPDVLDGPGEAGAECAFNRECHAALRCECTESSGCACKSGVRGTGQRGVDPCNDGNACASSVCVEGPPDSGSFCSDECKTSADCTGALPLCSDIAFVGRVCIRQPPK